MFDNKIFSKVFMWMFVGLMITFATGYYVASNPNMVYNIFGKSFWIFAIIEILLVIILSAKIHSMSPTTAKVMFCLYSFVTGLTFSSVFIMYQISSILIIFLITAVLCLILSLIAYNTDIDITKIGVYLLIALLGVIILEIINIFVGSVHLDMGLCILCLLIFLAYIAYDIQIIKSNMSTLPEDNLAIYGALQLYLDLINIFLRLLQLFGKSND